MSLRIHKIETNADGSIDVMYRGLSADFDYISGCLNTRKGVTVTKVDDKSNDVFDVLRVRGTDANPVTLDDVLSMLRDDQHIELMLSSDSPDSDAAPSHD